MVEVLVQIWGEDGQRDYAGMHDIPDFQPTLVFSGADPFERSGKGPQGSYSGSVKIVGPNQG